MRRLVAPAENNFSFFSFSVEINYEPVGCFKDKNKDRALVKLVKNFRGKKILGDKTIWDYWKKNQTSHIIQLCAEEAFRQGYTDMIGMQFYGECWSDKDAEKDYNKHGKSKNCVKGVGKKGANYVYRIRGR